MNSATRNFLRKRAHELKPVVMVGKNGNDERIVKALNEALHAHELVKIRFQDFEEDRREIAEELATSTQSEVVTIIGHVATLFRQNRLPEERLIHIPREMLD
ncbi:MAG: ribosome assembly RNA-binding protein YhbY [Sphaerochaetaceae bacterium]